MNRTEKEEKVKEIEDKLSRSSAVVLADYRGLKVHELSELRRGLRTEGVEFKVYKNTLVKRAADKIELSVINEHLIGPTAMAFGYDDPVTAAKLIFAFSKKNPALGIKVGLSEGRVIDAAGVKSLASLPSREVLTAKLAGALLGPVSAFANVLNAPIRGLAAALNQVAEQKK